MLTIALSFPVNVILFRINRGRELLSISCSHASPVICFLPQMQGRMIASFWEIIKSRLILWLRTVFKYQQHDYYFFYKKLNLLFFHLGFDVCGRLSERSKLAAHFLCFTLSSIHTGSNFSFATAFLPCTLLSVLQNQCRVSCD